MDRCIHIIDRWNTFKNPKYVYTRLYTCFKSVSKPHIEWLREKIIKLLCVKGRVYKEEPRRADQTTSAWKLRFAKKESIKLLSQIYHSSEIPYLKRKRKIAEKFI